MKFNSLPAGASESDARSALRSLIATGLNPPEKPKASGPRQAKPPPKLSPPPHRDSVLPNVPPEPGRPADHGPLLAAIARLPGPSICFLAKQARLAGTEAEVRAQFSAWCAAQPKTWGDWRKAWERFYDAVKAPIAIAVTEPEPAATVPEPVAITVKPVAVTAPPSWRPMVSTDGGATYAGNALRFATEAEAQDSAFRLFERWTMATHHRAEPSEEAPNYKLVDGELTELPKAPEPPPSLTLTLPVPAPPPPPPPAAAPDPLVAVPQRYDPLAFRKRLQAAS